MTELRKKGFCNLPPRPRKNRLRQRLTNEVKPLDERLLGNRLPCCQVSPKDYLKKICDYERSAP